MLVQKLNRLTQRRMIITFLIILFLLQIIVPSVIADNEEDTQSKIEAIIDETVSKSGASKISVGCFKDNDVKYYGQENNELYYQIGYTAREFISLGILSLVESEMIALEDSASDYIEGFNPQYNGSDCVVTIENLLTQSSGLDSSNVRYIKSSEELAELPYRINQNLVSKPGYKVKESDYNYSLMALIIENVSGQNYSEYLSESVLSSLLMNNTFGYRPKNDNVVNGKRLGYGKTINYNFGYSLSQQPTCYMYSNVKDTVTWMRELCGDVYVDESASTVLSQYKLLIDLNEGCSGWNHSDDIYSIVSILPNYSSALLMSIKDDIGVCVLADCNIGITIENLAQRIYEVLENRTVSTCTLDTMIKLDFTFIILTIMVFALIVYFIYKAANNKSKDSLGAVVPLEIILTLTTIAMLIYIPLRVKIGWYDLIMTWAPFSVVIGMIFLILGCICGLISSLVLKD